MEKKLVTIWRFSLAIQAEVAQCVLGNNGIQSFLTNENVVAMDWLIGDAVGGVKLEVAEEDAAAALELLEQNPGLIGKRPDVADEQDDSYKCLSCGHMIGAKENQCPRCGWSPQ